jgi:hypothetical protein
MTEQEMTTDSVLHKRELTVDELEAVTGGVLPEGFMNAVKIGIVVGWLKAGGAVALQ